MTISGGGIDRVLDTGVDDSATISGLTITGGVAAASGGGIASNAGLTLTDSTLSGNTASGGSGGGIFHSGTTATLSNVTIQGNTATTDGGGLITIGAGAPSAVLPATSL